MASDIDDIEVYSGIEQPPLLEQIKRILDEYRNDVQIIKELIQNADDAEATAMKILFEGNVINQEEDDEAEYRKFLRAPALVFYNDAEFTDDDWRGIRSIYTSVKRDDPLKVGRFGLGFKSVFHLTDFPCIISGENAMFINPHAKEFGKICTTIKLINLKKWKRLSNNDYKATLMGTFGFSEEVLDTGIYKGTMFWFPLRQKASALSDNVYPNDKVAHLLQAFITESNRSLLFLKTLCSIKLFLDVHESSVDEIEMSDGSIMNMKDMSLAKNTECFSVVVKSTGKDLSQMRKAFLDELKELKAVGTVIPDQSKHWLFHVEVETMSRTSAENSNISKSKWLILNYLKGDGISEKTKELISDDDLGYPHVVSLAAPINEDGKYSSTAGHVFCYQPLPQEIVSMTGLPVHINAFFALSQNRRHVRWPDQGDPTNGEGDKKIEWNIAIRTEVLPFAYVTLLEEMITLCNDRENVGYLIKGVYNTIPDINVVDFHWSDLAKRVLKMCKDQNILYTELDGGRWISPSEAVFSTCHSSSEFKDYEKTVHNLLLKDKLNLVIVSQHVLDALRKVGLNLKEATPAYLKAHMEKNQLYKQLNADEKHDLLEFIYLDISKANLEHLELLPLQDGTFTTFRKDKTVFKENTDVIELFPGKEASFVHTKCRQKTEDVLTHILEEGELCIENLNENSVAEMTHDVLSNNFHEEYDAITIDEDIGKWNNWISGIWRLLQDRFRKSIHRFSSIPLFPLISPGHGNKLSLLKLTSQLLYVPSFDRMSGNENIRTSFQHLSVTIIKSIPEFIDVEIVRPFLFDESSESLVKLLDRIGDVERYNNKCSDVDSKLFLDFLSERIHTKVGKGGSNNARRLKIFRGHQSTSQSRLVSLEDTNELYDGNDFPVSFPQEMIMTNSDQERSFAIHLGGIVVSELELVRKVLRHIRCLENCEHRYDPHECQKFIKWIITTESHFSYHDVHESLKEIAFLEATNGSFCKVTDLFDPSCKDLCDMFKDEHVFPKIDTEKEQHLLAGLRKLGLKSVNDITSADIEHVCFRVHKMANEDLSFDYDMCNTLLRVLNEHIALVNRDVLHDKSCILIEMLDEVECYSSPEIRSLRKEQTNDCYILCRPDKIKSSKHKELIGSVLHVIDCKHLQGLSDKFEWEACPAVSYVIDHMYNVVNQYKPEYKGDCIRIITTVYKHISDTNVCSSDEVSRLIRTRFKPPTDAFIWDGNAFQAIQNIYIKEMKGDVDLKPFLYPLPKEIVQLSSFFEKLGCRETLDFDVYVNTLELIKDSEDKTENDISVSDAYIEMAVSILNKLKKNFLQEAVESDRQLFFPTLRENGCLRMLPANNCTYCDEQWLENMNFQFDDDINYVHPDLPLATAEALGVPSLRKQMMSDAEAFEEWGQEEPLTRRLRNLLKEGYVDGFCVAKELFQNADDAKASKLWIMYDERENNDMKTQLISDEMADCQGPAIWVYNDELFTENDFKNITKLSGATKEEDSTKIGKFGLGFCAVYNITDMPSFLSGENFVIFDPDMSHLGKVLPGRSPGLRINFRVMKNMKMMKGLKNQFKPFDDVFGCKIADDGSSPFFKGTLFRLPLRNRASDICDVVYSANEVKLLFEKTMSMAANMFLFNQNVTEFKLFHLQKSERNPTQATLLFEIDKSAVRLLPSTSINDNIVPVLVETSMRKQNKLLSDNPVRVIDRVSINIKNRTGKNFEVIKPKLDSKVDWLVSWSSGTHTTSLSLAYEEKGALPLGAVAIPVNNTDDTELQVMPFSNIPDQFYKTGHLFFFLPLPIEHRFSFHINSQFSLTTDRRQLKTANEDDKNVKMRKWNKYLLKDSVANALLFLLENLHQFGDLSTYRYDILWPKSETSDIFKFLPTSFYRKVVQPEIFSVFERDGQWFDISKCVFVERCFRNSNVGDIAFEFLSQLTEFVVDVSEDVYRMLLEADQDYIEEKTVTQQSFFLDFFFPHLEDFASNMQDKRKKLLYFAVDLQDEAIDDWLKSNECIPSQPYGKLKCPSELVDIHSNLAPLFNPSDGRFPEHPFTEIPIVEKLKKLGLMWNVLDDNIVIDRICSVEKMNTKCAVCAMERAVNVISYLCDNISRHESIVQALQNTKFVPIQHKPDTWPFEWHADIVSSLKTGKSCKLHRKSRSQNNALYFERASNIYYGDCKHIIGCVAFIFDDESMNSTRWASSVKLRMLMSALGMNGLPKKDVNVRFVLKQLDIISETYDVSIDRKYSDTIHKIMSEIYNFLDKACISQDIFEIIANESKGKSLVFVNDAFITMNQIARHCVQGCKPFLYKLDDSPIDACPKLCKCIDIKDDFMPYDVAMVLQNLKREAGEDTTTIDIQTVINLLYCLRKSIHALPGKNIEVDDIVKDELEAIYGPDEDGIFRDCKTMCFNDYDEIEKDVTMIYAHENFPPNLAKYFGVMPKRVHTFEQSSEDFEDFYQDEPLVTRLNTLVDGYPCDSGIFKELIQNADDAGATEIHFISDYTTHQSDKIIDQKYAPLQGPALVVYNNSAFSNDDLKGIQKLGRGNKSDDPSQTGRYGVGFNAVYNLTDAPSFYTKGGDIENGETMCFFDPLAKYLPNVTRKKPGKRLKNIKCMRNRFTHMFDAYHEKFLITGERGTVFRFPLRTEEMAKDSEIKTEAVNIDKVSTLLSAFADDLCNVLLFLKHLRTVKISSYKEGKFAEEFCIEVSMSEDHNRARKIFVEQQKEMCQTFSQTKGDIFKFKQSSFIYELSMVLRTKTKTDRLQYLVAHTLGFDETMPVAPLIKKAFHEEKLQLLPHGGVALKMNSLSSVRIFDTGIKCKAFCFLPLPIDTCLPVHIHGYFALDHETRRTLWRSEDPNTCYRTLWNETIINHVLSSAYILLIETAKSARFKDMSRNCSIKTLQWYLKDYQALFPLTDKLTDIYWKDLLKALYKRLVDEKILFLPIQIATQNQFTSPSRVSVELTWTSLYITESNYPAYVNAEDGERESFFNNILRRIGMRVVDVSDGIIKGLEFADIGISQLKPKHVIEFMCSSNCQPVRPNECRIQTDKHVVQTVLHSVTDADQVMKFCMKDMENFERNVADIPLMVTHDNIVRTIKTNSYLYAEPEARFCIFFPSKIHAFLNDSIAFTLQNGFLENRNKSGLRIFTLSSFVELVKETSIMEYTVRCIKTWDKVKPGKDWVSLFWDFFLFRHRADGSCFNSQLQIIDNLALIPVVKRNSESCSLVPPCCKETVLNISSFSTNIILFKALTKLNMPVIDESSFGKAFLEEGMSLLQEEISHMEKPIAVLKCLHSSIKETDYSTLTDKDSMSILQYFNNCLKCKTTDIDKLKDLPLFLSQFGKRVALRDYTSIYVVPADLLEEGLLELANTARVLFLKNCGHKRLYKLLDLEILTVIDVYIRYIVPKQHMMTRKCFYSHLHYLSHHILTERNSNDVIIIPTCTDSNLNLLELLRITAFVEVQDRQMVTVAELYDPDHRVFKNMCEDSELVPQCLRENSILSVFRYIGLKSEMTAEMFERFARKIESKTRLQICERVKKESIILTMHLLSRESIFFEHANLKVLSKIEFVLPYTVDDSLSSIKEQYNATRLICFENAVVNSSSKISWTVANILPPHADPTLKYNSDLIIRKLGIVKQPCLSQLVRHCQTVCWQLDNILKKQNTVNLKELELVLCEIYTALNAHNRAGEFTEETRKNLSHLPIVYFQNTPAVVRAKCVTMNCKKNEEIPPYFMTCPATYLKFKELFLSLGASEEPSCLSYVHVLKSIKGQSGEKKLTPKEEADSKQAMGHLYRYLKDEDNTVDIQDNELFLLSRNLVLEHANMLVVPDNRYYEDQLSKTNSTVCVYHIEFEMLPGVHKTSHSDCIETLLHFPIKCRPHLLTDIVRERVILENIEEKDKHHATSLQQFIQSPFFVHGFLRLVRHAWKQEKRDWKENDEEVISKQIQKMKFIHCCGIETKLAIKCIENGQLGREEIVEGTNERKLNHLETTEGETVIYFDTSDSSWQREVNEHLTMFLSKLADQCLKDEYLIYLTAILNLCDHPEEIGLFLSKKRIEEYTFESFELKEPTLYPTPGEIVPEEYHEFLDNDYLIFEHDFKFVALEIDDPAFDLSEDAPDDEDGQRLQATYIYVHIIRKIGQEIKVPLLQEYEIDYGAGKTKKVNGSQLYKFIRKTENGNSDHGMIVLYERDGSDCGHDPQRNTKGNKSLNDIRREIRDILREAWKFDQKEKKRIVKRLFLKWHPDKNPNNVQFCTKVFQYIQQCLDRLEKGLNLIDEDDTSDVNTKSSNSSGSYDSSNSWYNRSWRRYSRGRQYHERKYEPFWSSQRSGHRNSYNTNFHNAWRSNHKHWQNQYFPRPCLAMAKLWYKQAEYDIRNAGASKKQLHTPQYNWVCFNAHQAAEKAMIAVWYAKDANKVTSSIKNEHNLIYLSNGVGCSRVQTLARRLSELTGAHSKMLYPESFFSSIPAESYTEQTAELSIQVAQDILDCCKQYVR